MTTGAPIPPPEVANPHDLRLPPAAVGLLRALFPSHARLVLEAEFAGGFSGSRVFTVTPYREPDAPELPIVVKLGPRDLIAQEQRAYLSHIRGRLSGVPEVWGEPAYSPDGHGAGCATPWSAAGSSASRASPATAEAPSRRTSPMSWKAASSSTSARSGARQSRPLAADSRCRLCQPISDRALADFRAALGDTVNLARDPHRVPPRPSRALPLPDPLAALPALLDRAAPHPHRHHPWRPEPRERPGRPRPPAPSGSSTSRTAARTMCCTTSCGWRPGPDHAAPARPEARRGGPGPDRRDRSLPPAPPRRRAEPPRPGAAHASHRHPRRPQGRDAAPGRARRLARVPRRPAAYLLGAGKYRNLDAAAKRVAFWAAAAALDLARASPRPTLEALERAIPCCSNATRCWRPTASAASPSGASRATGWTSASWR